LPDGWELHRAQTRPTSGALVIPHFVLQHRALLFAGDGRPFSALVETYTDQVLAF